MKTLQQVKELYKSNTIDGRDLTRLMQFIPESELKDFGIELKEEYVGKHETIPFTRENILNQLKGDVEFGFTKALNKRGLSAGAMFDVVRMWNWILEEGLEDFSTDQYPMYGLPLFKATALKYGWDNPIGDDLGSEDKYNEHYDEDI